MHRHHGGYGGVDPPLAVLVLLGQPGAPRVGLEDGVGDVPVTTAHRWVKEARRRGFLPPGRKGRRG